MNKDIFARADLLQKAGITDETLAAWLKAKLLRPAGYADDKAPLFTPETLSRVEHIQKLEALGYGLEEIQKIVRKIGLPKPKDREGRKAARKGHPYLTVGGLAERSGVSPRTIKHWEDKGIIEPDMRTEGGFRLYPEKYVFLCQLIRDLQLFGYTLEEIKAVSDEVRDLQAIQVDLEAFPRAGVEKKLEAMLAEMEAFREKMKLLREGVARWDDILKKKRKEIQGLRTKNLKRTYPEAGLIKQGEADA
jgi:DNA-binding transcriptional MerR regulator